MAKGINKVILVGNLGQDPDVKSTQTGAVMTSITLATSDFWRDKETGQNKEKTEWHRVTLFDRGNFKLGSIASQYLKKGSKVYIEGKLQTRQFIKGGCEQYITEIIANELQMLDSRTEAGTHSIQQIKQQVNQPAQQQPARQQRPQSVSKQSIQADFADVESIPY